MYLTPLLSLMIQIWMNESLCTSLQVWDTKHKWQAPRIVV
jgi:hypothetical protein